MKSVIITGANGLIGHYLVRELSGLGYKIYAVVRNNVEDISEIRNILNVEIVYCDLAEISKLLEIIKEKEIETFYHLAWAGSSGDLRREYKLQLWNVEKACDAVKIAYELKCKKFVGIGSVVELVLKKNILRDDFLPEPEVNYAIAKVMANYMCKSLCKQLGMEYNWAHIANLYGEGDNTKNIVNYVMQKYLSGGVPKLTNGDQFADFIYVSDVARAIALIGEKGKQGSTYYVGGNNIRPLKDFILLMRDMIDPGLESGLGKKKLNGNGVDYSDLDISKLKEDTGFVPEISFEEGIRKTIIWLKERDCHRPYC